MQDFSKFDFDDHALEEVDPSARLDCIKNWRDTFDDSISDAECEEFVEWFNRTH